MRTTARSTGLRKRSLFVVHVLIASSTFVPASPYASASAQPSSAGARSAALAGSPAASTGDAWSESNPAGWSDVSTHAVVVHAAQLYGMEELRTGSVQFVARLGRPSAALGIRTFGYEDYRETVGTAGLAGGIRAGTHRPFHFGFRIRYHRIIIRNYGSASAFALSTGLIFPVLTGVNLGLSAENVAVLESPISDDLPRRIQAGLAFIGSDILHGYVDVVKDVRSSLVMRISAEARPVRVIALRSGFSMMPTRFAGGVGFSLGRLNLDIAVDRHLVLGWSPSCSAELRW